MDVLKEFLQEFREFRSEVNTRFEKLEQLIPKVEKLDQVVNEQLIPKVEESHLWIQKLVENKEIQKAEMDNISHKVATIEGVLNGFDKSLDAMKKAHVTK